mgnify:CR=1 FL=1|jgi:hypothetical protein
MIKIRVDKQSTCIFVKAPDQIIDMAHTAMNANIDSINDKVFVDFYDVLDEESFDPRKAISNDSSNLKLLSQRIFDIRDFPFKRNNSC